MTQAHQPDETAFRAIRSENIDWKPFAAFPPSAKLAVVVGEPTEPGLADDPARGLPPGRCTFRTDTRALEWPSEGVFVSVGQRERSGVACQTYLVQ